MGIIGVVAAMTIPTLIANTSSAKFKSQFKKTMATLNQAGLLAQSRYGFDFGSITSGCSSDGSKDDPEIKASICAIFNGTLSGATYYQYSKNIAPDGSYTVNGVLSADRSIQGSVVRLVPAYQLADGAIVGLLGYYGNGCSLAPGETINNNTYRRVYPCWGFIDVNGTKCPNKVVSCSQGQNTFDDSGNCVVADNPKYLTDIFPIFFHDSTVEPGTAAARYVLQHK